MVSVLIGGEDRWELGDVIGSGGAGEVRIATCGDGEPHVIKLVPIADGALRELTITRNLDVPNVVPVLGTGRTETHLAMLMPKADRSLRDHIKAAGGPLPEDEALVILCDIAHALAGLAQARTADGGAGIVHRDLKPENVLYLDGAWSLSDFGIARHADHATEMHTRRYGMTPHYAAPEQWRGETAAAETDVYAFGVIAFELLMGSRPFTGTDLRQQHLASEAPPLTGISSSLATVIAECLYKHAGTRPSPGRLLRRLQEEKARATSGQTRVTTGGMSALQAAHLAETARRGQAAWQGQLASQHRIEQEELFRVATVQWEQISNHLRETIVENAPTCHVTEISDLGWTLRLGNASIVLSKPCKQAPLDSGSPALPFDVIAHCYLAVGRSVHEHSFELQADYSGRAHSLWFCDAQTEGQYGWYEVAFSFDQAFDSMGDPSLGYNGYFWVKSTSTGRIYTPPGHYLPIAAMPDSAARLSELTSGVVTGLMYGKFKIAWPFTFLAPGEADQVLDRWVTWFADASQGKLRRPSATSTPAPGGSWRTAGHSPESSVSANVPPAPRFSAPNQDAAAASALSGEVDSILREIGYGGGGYDGAHSVAVVLHRSSEERQWVSQELRAQLNIQSSPTLVFRRLSDKKARPAAAVGGLIGWGKARLAPLRFLDGAQYEEFTFASSNPRLVLVERRAPSRGERAGQLLAAFIVISAEPAALRGRSPSPSLRSWFDGPEMTLPRLALPEVVPPFTAQTATDMFETLLEAAGATAKSSPSNIDNWGQTDESFLLPGSEGQIDIENVPKPPSKRGRSARRRLQQ